MRRLVAGGWLRRGKTTFLTGSLLRSGFAQLDRNPRVLVEGRAARTRDRGMTVAERLAFARIKAELEDQK